MVLLVVVGGFSWFHVLVTTTLQGGYAVRKFLGEFVYHLTVHTGKTVAMLISSHAFVGPLSLLCSEILTFTSLLNLLA